MAKRKKTDEDLPEGSIENANDADSFGLPDIDYKPINRATEGSQESSEQSVLDPEPARETYSGSYQVEEQPKEESRYVYSPPEEKSNAPIIIGVVIGAVVIIAGFLIYNFVYKPKVEREKQEQLAKIAAAKKTAEEARLAKEREEAERKQRVADEAAKAKPAEGTIEILSAPTKRYYVVITSGIDADLTMDYAKKLSSKGVSTKIIPPFAKWKFNRLSISDYDTYALAQTNADAAKAEYGSGVWVIRY
jgi:cytoskeletal protein RodZ